MLMCPIICNRTKHGLFSVQFLTVVCSFVHLLCWHTWTTHYTAVCDVINPRSSQTEPTTSSLVQFVSVWTLSIELWCRLSSKKNRRNAELYIYIYMYISYIYIICIYHICGTNFPFLLAALGSFVKTKRVLNDWTGRLSLSPKQDDSCTEPEISLATWCINHHQSSM